MEDKKHNIDKFPGYPHYPDSEDITRAKNNNGKASIDKTEGDQAPFNDTTDDRDNETGITEGTDADVTKEDIINLDSADQNLDTPDGNNLQYAALDNTDDDGDPLNEESFYGDKDGDDLDVPGDEDDNADEAIGEEDEENNYYSLGGDNHEAQEENQGE